MVSNAGCVRITQSHATRRICDRPQALVTHHTTRRSVAPRALRSRLTGDKRNAGERNRNHLDIRQRHPCSTRSNGRRRSRSLSWHSKFPQTASTQASRFLPRRVTRPAVRPCRQPIATALTPVRTPHGFLGSPSSCRYLRCCPRLPRTSSAGARSQGLTEET